MQSEQRVHFVEGKIQFIVASSPTLNWADLSYVGREVQQPNGRWGPDPVAGYPPLQSRYRSSLRDGCVQHQACKALSQNLTTRVSPARVDGIYWCGGLRNGSNRVRLVQVVDG